MEDYEREHIDAVLSVVNCDVYKSFQIDDFHIIRMKLNFQFISNWKIVFWKIPPSQTDRRNLEGQRGIL